MDKAASRGELQGVENSMFSLEPNNWVFKNKRSRQFYPVKHISVFIDFKLGEFFFYYKFI